MTAGRRRTRSAAIAGIRSIRPSAKRCSSATKVCHPLIWLGCVDPAMSTEELRALDPVRNAVEEYVEELDAVFGRLGLTVEESAFTASDIYREAKRSSMVHSGGIDVQQPVHPKLRSLFSRDGRVMNVK